MIRIVAGIALSLGIATSAIGQEPAQNPPATEPASQPAAEAPALAPAVPASAPDAPAGKGRIVFFRPTRLPGAIYTYHVVEVAEDGKAAKDAPHLGDMPNGGGFGLEVEPGIHSYNITGPMAVNKAEDRLRMEIEPGETYYVEQTVRMGLVTGGFRLVPADEARLKASHVKLDASGK